MFQQQEEFEQIEDTAILWRYQDLPRYIDLLLKQQLFFCRADRFEDPFEGEYPLQMEEELVQAQVRKLRGNHQEELIQQAKAEVEKLTAEHTAKRTLVTINSWHYNTDDNYAMWKIYAKGTYGLAIQTTYEKLKRCFNGTDKPIFIGKVAYYDDSYEPAPLSHSLHPFLCKRKIYQYENEVRCCYVIPQEEKAFNWQAQDMDDGLFINADINTLIERIYISPYSPKWIRDIVAGINEKFDIEKEIVHSTVFDSADY